MDDGMDFGTTSTWDDWLIGRTPTGDENADGTARVLQDSNYTMQEFDPSSAFLRDGLRTLFDEFEAATAGQTIRGRAHLGWKRRGPDQWRVDADPEQGTITVTYGAQTEQGVFVVMNRLTGAMFVRDVVEALEAIGDEPS